MLLESEDGIAFTEVPANKVVGDPVVADAVLGDDLVVTLGYIGDAKFARLDYEVEGVLAADVTLYAMAVLGHPALSRGSVMRSVGVDLAGPPPTLEGCVVDLHGEDALVSWEYVAGMLGYQEAQKDRVVGLINWISSRAVCGRRTRDNLAGARLYRRRARHRPDIPSCRSRTLGGVGRD